MTSSKDILVYWNHRSDEPEAFGTPSAQTIRGKEVFSFAFDEKWLWILPSVSNV